MRDNQERKEAKNNKNERQRVKRSEMEWLGVRVRG